VELVDEVDEVLVVDDVVVVEEVDVVLVVEVVEVVEVVDVVVDVVTVVVVLAVHKVKVWCHSSSHLWLTLVQPSYTHEHRQWLGRTQSR
jgi:hypothetical protein